MVLLRAHTGVAQEVQDAQDAGALSSVELVDGLTPVFLAPLLPARVPQDISSMGDLLGIDNLVANTTYLKAQQIHRNELKKRRLSLTLPKPKASVLQTAEGETYESLCEQQPIGRKLFQQFLLTSNDQYVAAAEFLEELSKWSFAEEEKREKAKQTILAKFCQPQSWRFLSYLTGEDAEICKDLSDSNFNEVILDQLREATREFLKGKPFLEYLKSPFFYRFLQWKEYEKQKITDKYFYEFRTLGKGGFGEVGTKSISIGINALHCFLDDESQFYIVL